MFFPPSGSASACARCIAASRSFWKLPTFESVPAGFTLAVTAAMCRVGGRTERSVVRSAFESCSAAMRAAGGKSSSSCKAALSGQSLVPRNPEEFWSSETFLVSFTG
jgi:hypothetical protein